MRIRYNPDQAGLECVVGPLGAAVLEVLWDSDRSRMTNRQIQRELSRRGTKRSITTIGTTTRRLTAKKLLQESTPHGTLVYSPTLARNDLIDCVIERVMGSMIDSWSDRMETYLEGVSTAQRVQSVGGTF